MQENNTESEESIETGTKINWTMKCNSLHSLVRLIPKNHKN
jgi:hypothetical protein